jgi:hypothetical protein
MFRSTGEEVAQALCAISEKDRNTPRSILSDRGSDLWFGIKEFQKRVY